MECTSRDSLNTTTSNKQSGIAKSKQMVLFVFSYFLSITCAQGNHNYTVISILSLTKQA